MAPWLVFVHDEWFVPSIKGGKLFAYVKQINLGPNDNLSLSKGGQKYAPVFKETKQTKVSQQTQPCSFVCIISFSGMR